MGAQTGAELKALLKSVNRGILILYALRLFFSSGESAEQVAGPKLF